MLHDCDIVSRIPNVQSLFGDTRPLVGNPFFLSKIPKSRNTIALDVEDDVIATLNRTKKQQPDPSLSAPRLQAAVSALIQESEADTLDMRPSSAASRPQSASNALNAVDRLGNFPQHLASNQSLLSLQNLSMLTPELLQSLTNLQNQNHLPNGPESVALSSGTSVISDPSTLGDNTLLTVISELQRQQQQGQGQVPNPNIPIGEVGLLDQPSAWDDREFTDSNLISADGKPLVNLDDIIQYNAAISRQGDGPSLSVVAPSSIQASLASNNNNSNNSVVNLPSGLVKTRDIAQSVCSSLEPNLRRQQEPSNVDMEMLSSLQDQIESLKDEVSAVNAEIEKEKEEKAKREEIIKQNKMDLNSTLSTLPENAAQMSQAPIQRGQGDAGLVWRGIWNFPSSSDTSNEEVICVMDVSVIGGDLILEARLPDTVTQASLSVDKKTVRTICGIAPAALAGRPFTEREECLYPLLLDLKAVLLEDGGIGALKLIERDIFYSGVHNNLKIKIRIHGGALEIAGQDASEDGSPAIMRLKLQWNEVLLLLSGTPKLMGVISDLLTGEMSCQDRETIALGQWLSARVKCTEEGGRPQLTFQRTLDAGFIDVAQDGELLSRTRLFARQLGPGFQFWVEPDNGGAPIPSEDDEPDIIKESVCRRKCSKPSNKAITTTLLEEDFWVLASVDSDLIEDQSALVVVGRRLSLEVESDEDDFSENEFSELEDSESEIEDGNLTNRSSNLSARRPRSPKKLNTSRSTNSIKTINKKSLPFKETHHFECDMSIVKKRDINVSGIPMNLKFLTQNGGILIKTTVVEGTRDSTAPPVEEIAVDKEFSLVFSSGSLEDMLIKDAEKTMSDAIKAREKEAEAKKAAEAESAETSSQATKTSVSTSRKKANKKKVMKKKAKVKKGGKNTDDPVSLSDLLKIPTDDVTRLAALVHLRRTMGSAKRKNLALWLQDRLKLVKAVAHVESRGRRSSITSSETVVNAAKKKRRNSQMVAEKLSVITEMPAEAETDDESEGESNNDSNNSNMPSAGNTARSKSSVLSKAPDGDNEDSDNSDIENDDDDDGGLKASKVPVMEWRLAPSNVQTQLVLPVLAAAWNEFIGAIDIGDKTTLSDVRSLIKSEINASLAPKEYVFSYCGAPCGKKQEGRRLAHHCAPVITLLPPGVATAHVPSDMPAEFQPVLLQERQIKAATGKKKGKRSRGGRSGGSDALKKAKQEREKALAELEKEKKREEKEKRAKEKKEKEKKEREKKLKEMQRPGSAKSTGSAGKGGKSGAPSFMSKTGGGRARGERGAGGASAAMGTPEGRARFIKDKGLAEVPIPAKIKIKSGELFAATDLGCKRFLMVGQLISINGIPCAVSHDLQSRFDDDGFTLSAPWAGEDIESGSLVKVCDAENAKVSFLQEVETHSK
eukprot:TRINITY_DN1157_c0_g1_i9.p1 TRINITY_DN1157_c0_g1~~TRINITY_DN1157_c0_g1_i9.p1  ORF type:complete len:1602 (-),score=570.97 TRINITY_DN1157_c0_g1_i9:60-4271(-)